MYRMKLWDEDKWNIHSSSYNSSKYANVPLDEKKDDKKYIEQKYGQKEKSASSDYMRREDAKEKEDKEKGSIFEELEEKTDKQEMKEDEIQFKAAKQLFNEKKYETKKTGKMKDINTIEEAVKKAIEEEKKVIIMDN